MLRRITKNTSIMSLGTGVSMALGFIRDILLARFFGTSGLLEAFIVAFRIPNLFRSVMGEGLADSVATPVLSEYQDKKDQLFSIGNNLLSLSIVVLFVFTVFGMMYAKFFVMLLAPGFLDNPYKFSMAVSFTRITFLYLLFIGISVNSFSILYALKKFLVPSITPAFLNVSFIVGILFFQRLFQEYVLVLCVLSGGILQLILPVWSLLRSGFTFRFRLRGTLKDAAIIRMLKLFGPRVFSSIIYQLSVIIDTVLASFSQIVGPGAVAALWFANRYIHLPLALFIHSLCRVVVVDFSYQHSRHNLDDFKKLFVFSFQNIIFFIVPIAMIYLFLSPAIIDVVLRRGDFTAYSAHITSAVLFFYSFGLFFFCGIKLLVNAFYAIKDTATPARITALSLVINAIVSVILMFPLRVGGIALGSSFAAMVNFFLLYRMLVKKIGTIDWQDTRSQFTRVFILSLIIAGISRYVWDYWDFQKYVKAFLIAVAAFSMFMVGGYFAGLKQIWHVQQWILKKR